MKHKARALGSVATFGEQWTQPDIERLLDTFNMLIDNITIGLVSEYESGKQ
jgi:hypothetical protein